MKLAESVLDLARWAPSGDNTQPWRFRITSDDEFEVHGYDTRSHCVYDLDGAASQFAHGALLETITLAATRFGARAEIATVSAAPTGHIVYRVTLVPNPGDSEDPLVPSITERVVQRRPLSTRALSGAERTAIDAAVQPYRILWMDSFGKRVQMAALNAFSAHIRLTIPEAFAVHKATIEWDVTTSEDKMPSSSLGAPWFFEPVMCSAMGSWERVNFLNRYLGGTIMPRLLLDWIPGLFCSAHFALLAPTRPQDHSDYVDAGRAAQRLWLTATRLGFQAQPLYTPLVFSNYARQQRNFTVVEAAKVRARNVLARLEGVFGREPAQHAVFLGRMGPARGVKGRSVRLPLNRLIVETAPDSL
jgi:nitroreductase